MNNMTVYDYENITYRLGGMSTINDLKGSGQEGILFYLRSKTDDKVKLTLFIDKRDLARISNTIKNGRRWWKRFRLPKMVRQ